MNSYLICISSGSSVIGRAPVLLQVLPYSNSPHPSLLPCLSGIPLLSFTTLPPPSPFFQHTRRSASSTWLPPPYPQCTAVAACQGCGGAVSGRWGVGGSSPLSYRPTRLLLLSPSAAAASGCGHHGNSGGSNPPPSSTNTAPLPLPLLLQKPSPPPSPPPPPMGCVSFKLDLDSACGVTPAATTCSPAMLALLGNGRVWSTDLLPGRPSTPPTLFFIALVFPFYWVPSCLFASKPPKRTRLYHHCHTVPPHQRLNPSLSDPPPLPLTKPLPPPPPPRLNI